MRIARPRRTSVDIGRLSLSPKEQGPARGAPPRSPTVTGCRGELSCFPGPAAPAVRLRVARSRPQAWPGGRQPDSQHAGCAASFPPSPTSRTPTPEPRPARGVGPAPTVLGRALSFHRGRSSGPRPHTPVSGLRGLITVYSRLVAQRRRRPDAETPHRRAGVTLSTGRRRESTGPHGDARQRAVSVRMRDSLYNLTYDGNASRHTLHYRGSCDHLGTAGLEQRVSSHIRELKDARQSVPPARYDTDRASGWLLARSAASRPSARRTSSRVESGDASSKRPPRRR